MKILVLSHISELLGGAERSMLDVFDYWAKHYGVKPEFILREPLKSLAPAIEKRNWKYYSMGFTFWSDGNPPATPEHIFRNAVENARAVMKIEQIIQDIKPDLVITNSVVSPWAALAAHFQKIPHVWFVREYGDLDHGRVFEIGREKTWEDVGSLSSLVVTNSATLAQHVSQYIDKQKVTALYNPFNIDEIYARTLEKVPNPFHAKDSLKVVLTGNIARSKGQLEAIEAVGKLIKEGSNVELGLIGKSGGAEFSAVLEATITKYGIGQKVHMIGYQTNPLAYVAHADVGIMPSRMEAFGRVTFEYLVAGKPIVGSNSGATPEMVKDGTNGYLFEPENAESLARALKHYVNKPELINKHGQASKGIAEEMMRGPQNIEALYMKVKHIAESKLEAVAPPIHYLHRWLEYMEIAKQGIDKSGQLSLRKLARTRLRQKAKAVYIHSQRLKTKLTKH